ncbi:MAG: ASCH domain-containing protein, partial [Oscillospiraceae bacterium]
MQFEMNLLPIPFRQIKNCEKMIEIRCNDEKRKELKVGDTIVFSELPCGNNSITAKIADLYPCDSFAELVTRFDPSEFGCEGSTAEQILSEIREIYSEEREQTEGVL